MVMRILSPGKAPLSDRAKKGGQSLVNKVVDLLKKVELPSSMKSEIDLERRVKIPSLNHLPGSFSLLDLCGWPVMGRNQISSSLLSYQRT
jgi:hypothetical protein